MSSEERPLSRWSRRKAEARRKRGSAAPAIEEPPLAAVPAEAPAPQKEDDAPPADLPDVESLTADSDFAAFMKEGVPKPLRALALRKLWASDPAFNVIDDMVEYGEDFTDGGALLAGLKEVLEDGKEKARMATQEEETPAAADAEEPPSAAEASEPPETDAETADRGPDADDEPTDPAA